MTRATYISIINNPKANTIPVLYFYTKLKGFKSLGKINNEAEFGAAFFKWVTGQMRHAADLHFLRVIYLKVDTELNEHFNVKNGK
jgi:hypothetical protein